MAAQVIGQLGLPPRPAMHLALIRHPRWSPALDYQILTWKAQGKNIHEIATDIGRQRIAVEQRYHRLRQVPNCMKLLEEHGLSDEPWPMDGAG